MYTIINWCNLLGNFANYIKTGFSHMRFTILKTKHNSAGNVVARKEHSDFDTFRV